MNAIVGFSVFYNLPAQNSQAALQVQSRALHSFKNLQHCSISLGASQLEFWGHNRIEELVQYLPDGSLLALIGFPLGSMTLAELAELFANARAIDDFEPPWEGRFILLYVNAYGTQWRLWNDWLGSIPVFHAPIENGRLASTLEPITVAAAGYTADDFFMPGLITLLINGHYLGDWTLYKDMHIIPPDSYMTWDEHGFRAKQLWTVQPSQNRWETSWDDLVDEMHELSHKAIAEALKTQPAWSLPLSSGLDSRMIAGVAADIGTDMYAYAWGGSNTTDVNYSRQIARTLGFPWKHIKLQPDFLVQYIRRWADLFGSAMHFHGMYQMCFLDALQPERPGPVISGFIGDVLSGDGIGDLLPVQTQEKSYQLTTEWYADWTADQLRTALRVPYENAFEANAEEYKKQKASIPGAFFQKMILLELWNRQRFFTVFQSTLAGYWRGVATPYLNKAYARFCLSLPRAAVEDRRLLGDVFRRYYGRLAVIPGTYAKDPFILTGKYLLFRRAAEMLPPFLHRGPLRGYGNIQLRMDIESIQYSGKDGLWPLFEAWNHIAKWLDTDQLIQDFQAIVKSKEDIRPLRRLQAAQTLAYRLLVGAEGNKA